MKEEHLQIVDDVLLAHAQRLQGKLTYTLPAGRSLPDALVNQWTINDLRASKLGQDLVDVAHFAEGTWSLTLSIEQIIQRVYRELFGNPLTEEIQLPRHFHRMPLGCLIHQALVRLYQDDELLPPGQVWRMLRVARQTVYDWVGEGKLMPVYVEGKAMFPRRSIEALQRRRSPTAPTEQA